MLAFVTQVSKKARGGPALLVLSNMVRSGGYPFFKRNIIFL
jgi:hypothetical protein